MKKLILLAVILFSVSVISASAQARVRVKFGKNMYEKTLIGSIKGSDYIDYVVRIEEYQFIQGEIKSANKNVKMTVRKTDGSEFENGVGVRIFDGEANKTGDYVFRVYVKGGAKTPAKFSIKISSFMGT